MSRDYVRLYEELGFRFVHNSGKEAVGFCPVHADIDKPSFSFDRDTGAYKCFAPDCAAFSGGMTLA